MNEFHKALYKAMHKQNMASIFTAHWRAATLWQRTRKVRR